MPTYQFEAMDATGQEIKDVIEAQSEEEAQQTIRQMGYFVTKISVKKGRVQKKDAKAGAKKGRTFALGGASSRQITTFTRQLSILQDAGLPILRSLRILEQQQKPGALRNALMDTCDEIEAGSTLSESMAKSPRVFNRLYVNMIKAGEAGGALEVILQRLADFQERAEALKRQVKGAMIYPIMVVLVAVGILTFIMIKIVPAFEKIFADFETELPLPTKILVSISWATYTYWYLIPGIPIGLVIALKLLCKFKAGKMGWDMYSLRLPIFGNLVEKNTLARTTRTLGTLVSSGVPILEGLNITRETAGNAVFERMFGKVSDSIREGETIAKPLKEFSRPGFHWMALTLWILTFTVPLIPLLFVPKMGGYILPAILAGAIIGGLIFYMKMNKRVVDDLVVNMVDVGEETGELDTMLYKVADTFDDEVSVITSSLTKLMEPLLIIFLGGAVGFIVIALFLPLIKLIQTLS
jgi:type IV pilus assembly protein PilC